MCFCFSAIDNDVAMEMKQRENTEKLDYLASSFVYCKIITYASSKKVFDL